MHSQQQFFAKLRAYHKTGPRIASLTMCTSLLVLCSCATYTPVPLSGDDIQTVLASPDRVVLIQAATALKHPYLVPIQLDFNKPLTPVALGVIAVLANPDLRAMRARESVSQAQVFAAGLLPDPTLSLTVDHALRPSDAATAYAGSLTFDLLGALATAAVDKQIINAAAAQVRLDLAWQEWLTANQAQLLATRLHYQREAEHLAQAAKVTARTLANRIDSATRAGDVSHNELINAVTIHADATARASSAVQAMEATRLDLNRTLGLQPNEVINIDDHDLPTCATNNDVEGLFAQARTQRLDLRALEAGYESKEASVHRAVLGQYPRLTISLNRARDNGRVQSIGPTVNFDVPLWNRNRGALATGAAERAAVGAEYAARLYATRADIAALVAALREDERGLRELTRDLPILEHTASALDSAARRGDVKLADADTARAVAIDKRLALLSLQQACSEQQLALHLALGLPINKNAENL